MCSLAMNFLVTAQVGPPLAANPNTNNGYGFTQSSGTYTPLSASRTVWQLGAVIGTDLVSSAISLPSPFTYNNQKYSSVYISNNGFITLGGAAAATTYTGLSTDISPTTYDGAFAGFAVNLRNANTTTSEISYETVGTKFIVQFTDVQGSTASAAQLINFQIQLDLTAKTVAIVYGNCVSGTATLTGQVGIRGSESSDVNNRTGTDWTATTIGTSNTSTCTLGITNAATVPASGLTFTYTPGTWLVAPTTYATLPFVENFGTWANGNSTLDLPNATYWRTWPARGDNAWRQSDISTTGFTSASGWSGNSGSATVSTPAVAPTARFHSYNCQYASGYMDLYVNLSTGTGNRFLSFDYINPSGSDVLKVQLSTDGGNTFTDVGSSFGVSASWVTNFLNLGSSSPTAIVRFLAKGDNGSDDIYIDNVKISAITIPDCAVVSSPANAATGVSVTPTINWNAVAGATSYKINLGTTPGGTNVMNGIDVGNVTTYTIPTATPLLYSTNYYVTILPVSSFGTASGCTESTFTTTTIPCPTVSAPAASAAGVSLTPTFTWGAVTSATGYKLRIGTAAGASDVLNDFDMGNVTTYTLPAALLNNSTTYYYTVKSYTATSTSASCTERNFTTVCVATTAPYSQNFDTTPTGSSTVTNAPTCWSYVETTGSAGYGYVYATSPNSTPNCYYLYNAGDTTGNVMLVSPQTTNLTNGTKQVRFMAKAGGSGYTMQVGTLTDPANPASFTVIGSSIALTTSWAQYVVAIPAGTDQYLALKHGLGGSSRSVYLDDIFVENIPTCFAPTAITMSNITASSATVSWTAATPAPVQGYDIYYSASSTAPAPTATPNQTGVMTLTTPISPLSPLTKYYVWVRSHCTGTDLSAWSSVPVSFQTLCQPPALLSTTGATVCPSNTATLSATADAGATITWYDAATGGTVLGTGSTYTTPVLTTTTNYWATASTGSTVNVGPVSPAAEGGTQGAWTIQWSVYFTTLAPTKLQSVTVYPVASGEAGELKVYTGSSTSGTLLATIPYTTTVSGGSTPQVIVINLDLPTAASYNIYPSILPTSGLTRNTAGAVYPYTSSMANITGNGYDPTYYMGLYNFVFTSKCESARQMATATVSSAGCLGTSETSGKDGIKVYPNPFTDVINISDVNNVKSISVVDVAGRLVKTFDKPSSTLYLGELNSGMYLVVLNMKDGSKQTIKAIKK